MSICDPETLINLYDWLETIPFSRPKKNLARDFSDGILTAELIKYFFPNLVEIHNYPCSNAVEQKKINWVTLNHKVLKKLDFPLSDATMNDLASGSKRDATEYFLDALRGKIDERMKRKAHKMKGKKDSSLTTGKAHVNNLLEEPFKHDLNGNKRLVDSSFQINEISRTIKTKSIHINDTDLESVPREIYDEKVQELLACQETIHILKARIQRLEYMLQLKNVTIDRHQQALDKLKEMYGTKKSPERKSPPKKPINIIQS